MEAFNENDEYLSLVDDILKNNNFNKLKYIEHHGTTRFEHSYRVSYYAYKIARKLNLNYESTARAGLLHDFFYSEENRTQKEKFISMMNHTKKAAENASKEFDISGKEYDIIITHMWPFCLYIPKHIESWLVVLVDKTIGAYEWKEQYSKQIKKQMIYVTNILAVLLVKVVGL